LLAGSAEAIQRDTGCIKWPARVESSHPGDVHAVVAATACAAHDDVLHLRRVGTNALLKGDEYLSDDPLRVRVVKATRVLAIPARRSNCVDDPSLTGHVFPPIFVTASSAEEPTELSYEHRDPPPFLISGGFY
jgi:hypothetical protein